MEIAAHHPDAPRPLLGGCARVLESMGARVVVDAEGANLVRSCAGSDVVAVVEAQGLANLVHELVHVLFAGRLADDHGIDYGAIPFDLEGASGRAILWQELACIVVSCAYVAGDRAGIDEWFAEQLEIQPVFYGWEHDPETMWCELDRARSAEPTALNETIGRAYAMVEQALREVESPPAVAQPAWHLEFGELWSRFRGHRVLDQAGSDPIW